MIEAAEELISAWMRPEVIDAIARRVLELGSEARSSRPAETPDLLTVADVARRLSVSTSWVYAHKRDLGVLRLGDGPKARLRFDARAVLAELNPRNRAKASNESGNDTAPQRSQTTRLEAVAKRKRGFPSGLRLY
jgi:hypothetical protein